MEWRGGEKTNYGTVAAIPEWKQENINLITADVPYSRRVISASELFKRFLRALRGKQTSGEGDRHSGIVCIYIYTYNNNDNNTIGDGISSISRNVNYAGRTLRAETQDKKKYIHGFFIISFRGMIPNKRISKYNNIHFSIINAYI